MSVFQNALQFEEFILGFFDTDGSVRIYLFDKKKKTINLKFLLGLLYNIPLHNQKKTRQFLILFKMDWIHFPLRRCLCLLLGIVKTAKETELLPKRWQLRYVLLQMLVRDLLPFL